ncbi:MAG: PatB family C-S lyase [Bacteroidales bacterium]|nr:PatB family C-S lyase [Bacteroidales bacterium]
MQYDFNEIIARKGTASFKHDLTDKFFQQGDILPMWVADMDFRTPDFILEALQERIQHPVLGYSFHPESQYQSIISWLQRRFQWNVGKEWIGFSPGVVPALNLAVLEFTRPGDKVLIQTPVYFPFYSAVKDHGREMVLNPLTLSDGRYQMDLENFISQIDERTTMLILCSPHNPTGNVWRKDELESLMQICLEKNILVISDEIHADIVYPPHQHIPTASLSPEISANTLTFMSASKTFNIAGLSTSFFIASSEELFKRMEGAIGRLHLSQGNIFGNVAMEAAYTYGALWLDELIAYLAGNVRFAKEFINNCMPGVSLIEPEATFLLWLDFRASGFSDKEVRKLLVEEARVGLSNGILFGPDGEGFQRINIGCPRSVLEKGLAGMSKIFTI